jgi:nitrogenase molybdenum-iron protein alpha/beta subunit
MAAEGRRPSWIFQIPITFEPLDQSLRNLVANFGPTRAITRNVQIYQNPRWRLKAGGHLGFFQIPITFEPLDQSLRNLAANFGPTRAITRNAQIYQNPRWWPKAGGHLGFFQIPVTFEPLDQSFQNLVANFGPTRAITRNVQIYQNPRWRPQAGGHLGFFKSLKLLNRSTDPFKIWWPTSDLKGLLPEIFKFSKIQDGGRRLAEVPMTFEPLDRSFRNLVANF